MWLLPIALSSVSSHPPTHTNPSRTAHYRVAQRVLASQSSVDALQLLPHRAWPCHPPLHPATLCAVCTRSPVPWPLLPSRAHPISSFPAHIIHHPSTIPSAVSLVPASSSRLGLCSRWTSTWPWTALHCLGLVRSDISTSAGSSARMPVSRNFLLDTTRSASPRSHHSSTDNFFWLLAACLEQTIV